MGIRICAFLRSKVLDNGGILEIETREREREKGFLILLVQILIYLEIKAEEERLNEGYNRKKLRGPFFLFFFTFIVFLYVEKSK